jgi:hypothetical protein
MKLPIPGLIVLLACLAPTVAAALPRCPSNPNIPRNNCQGTFTYPNGEKYVGEYKDGLRGGQGTYTFPNGEKYVGEFRDDKFNGKGTYTYANGEKYVGEYKDGVRSGQGTNIFPNGDKYFGELRDDKFNGRGTLSYADGEEYVGEFEDGLRNGQGTFTYLDRSKYVGEWKDDESNGKGVFFAADGSVVKSGIWANGELVTPDAAVANAGPQQSDQQAPLTVAPQGRRVALVIGNARYQNVEQLKNPINDAKAVASALEADGFASVTLKSDLGFSELVSALRDFSAVAAAADWAVVYYAGHGIQYGGVNYLIPVDAKLKFDRDIELETVDLNKILSSMEGASKLRLVILDACRNNPFAVQMTRTSSTRSVGRGLVRIEPDAGTLVIYSARDGQEALDGDGADSPFASALVNRLQSPNLEVRRLFDLVRDDVMDATNKQQQPFSYGSLSGREEFFFVSK